MRLLQLRSYGPAWRTRRSAETRGWTYIFTCISRWKSTSITKTRRTINEHQQTHIHCRKIHCARHPSIIATAAGINTSDLIRDQHAHDRINQASKNHNPKMKKRAKRVCKLQTSPCVFMTRVSISLHHNIITSHQQVKRSRTRYRSPCGLPIISVSAPK